MGIKLAPNCFERMSSRMSKGLRAILTFIWPSGLLFLAAVGFLRPHGLPPWCQGPVAALPYLALAFGVVFGWYFANARMILSLLTLTFADQALTAWPLEQDRASVSHTIFAASTLLLPLNFLALSIIKEQAIGSLWGALRLLPFLVQPLAVLWLCDPAHHDMAVALETAYIPGWGTAWTPVPQPALLVFTIAGVLLVVRFALRRHPMDAGATWALAAAFLAYHGTHVGWSPTSFFSTAGLILFGSLVQATYQETYRDDLTGIPGRIAYEEATAQLGRHYAVAVLAVDQLKVYAGVHGKSVTEQILKFIAQKVEAGCRAGRVFRVSGEELTLLFPHQSALDALVELEHIRKHVETTILVLDGHRIWETSTAPAGSTDQPFPITASIGVADTSVQGSTRTVVIKAAYRALYEAKAGGGNVVKRGAASSPSVRRPYRYPVPS
jgi:diguanylate cyclase (GGDEF)-like protein